MKIRDLVGLSRRRQRQLVRLMELSIGLLFVVGLLTRTVGIIVHTGVGLAVTQLPTLLRRDFDISLDIGLTLWITTAIWLHTIGTVPIPGGPGNLYATIGWYDHLTHTLSASVVAATGYITVRSIDEHAAEVSLPPKFAFVFVLLFVLAFGVLWEVLEFVLAEAASRIGAKPVLTQHGLGDTMLDLVFDTIGAVVVAIWGTAHLTGAVTQAATWLGDRSTAE